MYSIYWLLLLASMLWTGQIVYAHIRFGNSDLDSHWSEVYASDGFSNNKTTPNVRRQGPPPVGVPPGWFNAGQTTGPLVGINFPDYCHERDRMIANGFPELLLMARAALQYMEGHDDDGNPDPRSAGQESFHRYFDEQSREVVFSVLQTLFEGRPKDGIASSDFNKVTFSMDRPQDIDLSSICNGEIAYGCLDYRYLGLNVNSCSGLSGAPADADISFAVIMICRQCFQYGNLAPWLPISAANYRCNIFQNGKNYAQRVEAGQRGMNSLSSTVFHEMMHLKYAVRLSKLDPLGTGTPPGKIIIDYWAFLDTTNTAQQPASGYGPWNTWKLRKVSQSDPKMDTRTPQWNADSYVWFALEAYWGRLCNINFIDPPKNDDTFDDLNAVLEDGTLEDPPLP